jgi:hypothetical protein
MALPTSLVRTAKFLGGLALFLGAFAYAYVTDPAATPGGEFGASPFPPRPAGVAAPRIVRVMRDGTGAGGVAVGVFDAEFGEVERRAFAARRPEPPACAPGNSEKFAAVRLRTDADGYAKVPWSRRPLAVVARDASTAARTLVEAGFRGEREIALGADEIRSATVVDGKGAPAADVATLFEARDAEGRTVERVVALTDAAGRAEIVNAFADRPSRTFVSVVPRRDEAQEAPTDGAPVRLSADDLTAANLVPQCMAGGARARLEAVFDIGSADADPTLQRAAAWIDERPTMGTNRVRARRPAGGGVPSAQVRAASDEERAAARQVAVFDASGPQYLPTEQTWSGVSFGLNAPHGNVGASMVRLSARPSPTAAFKIRPAPTQFSASFDGRSLDVTVADGFPQDDDAVTVEALLLYGSGGCDAGAAVYATSTTPGSSLNSGSASLGGGALGRWRRAFCVDCVDGAGNPVAGIKLELAFDRTFVVVHGGGDWEAAKGGKLTTYSDATGRVVGFAAASEGTFAANASNRVDRGSGYAQTGSGMSQTGSGPHYWKCEFK